MGVSEARGCVALVMKLYPLGSVAQQLERCEAEGGLPLQQALRWVDVCNCV
jgi:hypothetical protein